MRFIHSKKNIIFISLLMLNACSQKEAKTEKSFFGFAQGTTYQIKFLDSTNEIEQTSFDSIFELIDMSMSTYVSKSEVSKLNNSGRLNSPSSHFLTVLERSREINLESNSKFDISIGPLVNYWGFGVEAYNKERDSTELDSVMALVGMDHLKLDSLGLKLGMGSKIDFNAIAQGYTVDVLSNFLNSKKVDNYLIEVGGELIAKGTNEESKVWRIGIDKPAANIDEQARFQIIIELKNKALATSGNYRKFWIDKESGIKYSHTISPITGMPAKNNLLSATVIANNCMDADAYATCLMVLGLEEAKSFLKNKPELEAYLIYSSKSGEWKTYQTPGFEKYILN